MPNPGLLHPEALSPQQSTADPYLLRRPKHSSVSVSVGCLGLGTQTRCGWALWASLKVMGFISKCSLSPPTILLGLPLCPWMWGISSKSLQWCVAAAPVPCSQRSSAYCLAGAFLYLDVWYLLPVPPVHCSCPPALSSKQGVSPHSWSSMVQVNSNAVRALMHRNLECYVHESRPIGSGQIRGAIELNIDILGIGELKWTGMSEFNSDDHFIY